MPNDRQVKHPEAWQVRHKREQDGNGPAIRIDEVRFGQGVLRRHRPITLHPRLSACGNYLEIEFEDIDMTLTAPSMAELESAVKAALEMTWELYAEGDPQEMTPGAQKLGQRMRTAYRFVQACL